MVNVNEMSANQIWRESKTTLSFKNWINREKSKFISFDGDGASTIVNKPLNAAVQDTISNIKKTTGFQDKETGKTILGMNKTYLAIGVVAAVVIGYYLLNKKK